MNNSKTLFSVVDHLASRSLDVYAITTSWSPVSAVSASLVSVWSGRVRDCMSSFVPILLQYRSDASVIDDEFAREIRIPQDRFGCQASFNTIKGVPFLRAPFPLCTLFSQCCKRVCFFCKSTDKLTVIACES